MYNKLYAITEIMKETKGINDTDLLGGTLLLNQYQYGCFNGSFKQEVENFVEKFEHLLNRTTTYKVTMEYHKGKPGNWGKRQHTTEEVTAPYKDKAIDILRRKLNLETI